MDRPVLDLDAQALKKDRARKNWMLLVGSILLLLLAIGWVARERWNDRQLAEQGLVEARKQQVRDLFALSGLDLTTLTPPEYAEAKLAESDPERLRALLIHLAENRADFWIERYKLAQANDRREPGEQILAFQRAIYCLKNWKPGITAAELGEVKFSSLGYAMQQETRRLQVEIERLKAGTPGTQR